MRLNLTIFTDKLQLKIILMDSDNLTKLFLKEVEQSAKPIKDIICQVYINRINKDEHVISTSDQKIFDNIQTIRRIIEVGLAEGGYENVLEILSLYKQKELIELYQIETIRDLKQLRAKILPEYDFGN
jgi:hypothetical protein